MFNQKFLSVPADEITAQLREEGVFAFERALEPAAVDQIMQDIGDLSFTINTNGPPNVVFWRQTFANHFLASSRTAFEVVVHERVLSVLRSGLGETFRMVGKRIYETRAGSYMQFHSDTSIPCTDPRQLDTIVFIFYMNDVEQGEWEIIERSHLWGETTIGSMENDQALLERGDVSVKSFRMPKGSLVVYNGRVLHRAKMFDDPEWARRSLFFQVNRNARNGEPVLVNTGFIRPDLTDEAKMLLGFGQRASVNPYPPTTPEFMPHGDFPAMDRYLARSLPLKQLAAMAEQRPAAEADT